MSVDVRLSFSIMHLPTNPQRRALVQNMIAKMGGPKQIEEDCVGWEIVEDYGKFGPQVTSRRAWLSAYRHSRSTHHLVLQDDAVLCKDFLLGVASAIEYNPRAAISLYANRRNVETAKEMGISWASFRDGLWGVAVVIPTDWISTYMAWAKANIPPVYPHDDRRLGLWLWEHDLPALGTVPSLVEHGGWNSSTLGHSQAHSRARWFIGEDVSALSVDWSKGCDRPVPTKPNYSLNWLRKDVDEWR